MNRLNVTDARREALFASQLQQADAPTAQAVVEAIRDAVHRSVPVPDSARTHGVEDESNMVTMQNRSHTAVVTTTKTMSLVDEPGKPAGQGEQLPLALAGGLIQAAANP
jgi:hypothetical protein